MKKLWVLFQLDRIDFLFVTECDISNSTIIEFETRFPECRVHRERQKSTRSRVPMAVKCPAANPPTGARSSILP